MGMESHFKENPSFICKAKNIGIYRGLKYTWNKVEFDLFISIKEAEMIGVKLNIEN